MQISDLKLIGILSFNIQSFLEGKRQSELLFIIFIFCQKLYSAIYQFSRKTEKMGTSWRQKNPCRSTSKQFIT